LVTCIHGEPDFERRSNSGIVLWPVGPAEDRMSPERIPEQLDLSREPNGVKRLVDRLQPLLMIGARSPGAARICRNGVRAGA
jgi:hypothetical protein